MRNLLAVVLAAWTTSAITQADHKFFTVQQRLAALDRARVWEPRDTAAADVRIGPPGPGGFEPEQAVDCEFDGHPESGRSPKFHCKISGDDRVKVKYGRNNGEVYGEVAATRLLWLLGFYADRMYPVSVRCHGCPPQLHDTSFAAIERPLPGREVSLEHRTGWEWGELDIAKGSPRAHRDALKLLAVMIQHSDSKSEQQRLLCVGKDGACDQAVAMINDLGLTFGRTSLYNRSSPSAVNFEQWRQTPVWKGKEGCVGNLPRSYTGSLENPVISEAGRAFLA